MQLHKIHVVALLSALIPLLFSHAGEQPADHHPPEIPAELRLRMDKHAAMQKKLREDFEASLAKLHNPTPEETKRAIEEFRDANTERYQTIRIEAIAIKNALLPYQKDSGKMLGARPARLPAELKTPREFHQAIYEKKIELRHALAKAPSDAAKEDIRNQIESEIAGLEAAFAEFKRKQQMPEKKPQ